MVNFSAIEAFFEEKRPFFTQGQQLFDLRTYKLLGNDQQDRLANTRRIGAAPDVGNEPNSDVLAAAKYTGIRGDNEYGVFAATERASQLAQGRQFVAGRWRHVHDNLSLGYLGTATVHPLLPARAVTAPGPGSITSRPAQRFHGEHRRTAATLPLRICAIA